MKQTTFQHPELRDANDNIIQQGAFGKNTALANSTNDGWIDYVANDLEFLYDIAKDEVVPVPSLPASGQMNKTYLLTTTGVSYRWSGTEWVAVSSSEAVGRAETAATNAQNYANAAQQSADAASKAADSETAAKASEAAAKASETAAKAAASDAKQSEATAKEYAKNAADALTEVNGKAAAIMECTGFKFVLNAADGGIDIVPTDTKEENANG